MQQLTPAHNDQVPALADGVRAAIDDTNRARAPLDLGSVGAELRVAHEAREHAPRDLAAHAVEALEADRVARLDEREGDARHAADGREVGVAGPQDRIDDLGRDAGAGRSA